jgi:organic radical activating enzyme
MLTTRTFPESNYRALHFNGKTLRIALDPTKPITELAYPEFYDIKVTSWCKGGCPYCYQSSIPSAQHVTDIVDKFRTFFRKFNKNQMPFQIAFGGGEPTSHPEFIELLKCCSEMGIVPNYTTNGMWKENNNALEILAVTKELCGGVAVSTHPHLEKQWRLATETYLENNIHTNLHVIISDKKSIDRFADVYKEFTGKVKYFVLLPLSSQGRSIDCFSDWEYLTSKIDGSPRDVAFGANFHPYLVEDSKRFSVSLYEPECMSAYLDLETMKIYKSSFSSEERVDIYNTIRSIN